MFESSGDGSGWRPYRRRNYESVGQAWECWDEPRTVSLTDSGVSLEDASEMAQHREAARGRQDGSGRQNLRRTTLPVLPLAYHHWPRPPVPQAPAQAQASVRRRHGLRKLGADSGWETAVEPDHGKD
jgi:hypothetical protein